MNRFVAACKAFMDAWRHPSPESTLQVAQVTHEDPSHLRLLALLQARGRLIDFLKEDISSFSDAQVGAAVRQVHSECAKVLEEVVTIRPVLDAAEGSSVTVPAGYDPIEIKVVGKLAGAAPFAGAIAHKGWKAHKHSLPKGTLQLSSDILASAEVEVR